MGPAVNHRSEWVLTCRPDLGKGGDVGELPSGLGCSLAAGQRRPLFEAFVMVLLGSLLALLASAAGLVTLGSSYILGEVSAVAFAVSLFILICATEART
jgi:hypothetical protein